MEDDEGKTPVPLAPPTVVSLAAFTSPLISPSSRRLSSHFSEPTRPVQSGRRLSWVSLQGRIVDAEESSSAKAIGGRLSGEEAVAWDLFSPIHRILIVAVVAVAAADLKKDRQIWRLRRSVNLRDQVLLNMQQKLDDLCEQVNNMKDGPDSVAKLSLMTNKEFQLSNDTKSSETKVSSCGCYCCDQHQDSSHGFTDSFEKTPSGDEMFKFKMPILVGAEQEERRMSDLSDWASSVTSAADMQLNSLAIEQDIYNLRRECEEKDVTIKELSAAVHATEVANSKRVTELEDIIRRKNMIITKLKKDMVVLEQKMLHLMRLRRPSSSSTVNNEQLPVMTDNLLYDMDSLTSSSDSDGDLRNQPQASVTKEDRETFSNENAATENRRSSSVKPPKLQPVFPLKETNLNQMPDLAVTVRPKQSAHGDHKGSKRRAQRGSNETSTSKRWH